MPAKGVTEMEDGNGGDAMWNGSAGAFAAAHEGLSGILGDRLSTAVAVREGHGRGEGLRTLMAPDAVAFPKTTAEVAEIVRLCAAASLPLIPFGVGTSLEGHVQAPFGGLCVDLSLMTAVLEINAADLDCRVEAGVTREALNLAIRHQGLFFPLDPGANATLGGMAATRASGTNAVRYGTMREVTLGLTVVTPAGEIVRTGGRARKSSAGYDLTRLYIGSEGTLGVITEVQLRLFGVPETIAAAACPFETLEGAVSMVTAVLQSGIQVARIELLDALQMSACIAYSKLDWAKAAPTLFIEFHGAPAGVAEQVAQVRALAEEFGGSDFRWADKQEDRSALWSARHNAYWAARALRPGCEAYSTDACVPISVLADTILKTRRLADDAGLVCPIVGHVGDGNFHALVLFDPKDGGEQARADVLVGDIARLALSQGGTVSGEHGIGMHKLEFMEAEHGTGVAVMQTLKRALDPKGIMNPGKTVPMANYAPS
jgi:D-lactate dehydrogenase (cytochrome)